MPISRRSPSSWILAALLALVGVILLTGAERAEAVKVKVAQRAFTYGGPEGQARYEVRCPGRFRPLGGGAFADPPINPVTGAGVYPVSSERLGVQNGWHVSVVKYGTNATYRVRLQAFCVKFKGRVRTTVKELKFRVGKGQTRTVKARCRGGKKWRIIGGGHLTTHFFSPTFQQTGGIGKGVYVTESRRVGTRKWRATATGIAGSGHGGRFNPLAYCYKGKNLLRQKVGVGVLSSPLSLTSATTPRCPRRKPIVGGGFKTASSQMLVSNLPNNRNRTFSASASAYPLPAPTATGAVTAYAYCLKKRPKKRK